MTRLYRQALGWALVLALLLHSTAAAPASNSTKITQPADALVSADNDGENSSLCKSKDTEIDCDQTEYSEYMACVEAKRAIRKKRHTSCSDNIAATASSADTSNQSAVILDNYSALSQCEFDRQRCLVGCQMDSTCESGCPSPCPGSSSSDSSDVVCPGEYHTCVANCKPGQSCETTCKNLCPGAFRPLGYKTVIFEGHNGDQQEKIQVPIGIGHNITTIIKLNNYINTTNHINVPTNINNTNFNTVHLYTNQTEGGAFGLGQTKDGDCCFAVQPKSCRTSTSGLRCHHRRHRTCGKQCTSRVIHAQSQTSCNRRGKCNAKVSYVPEPSPRCHYVPQWPYVTCGGQQGQGRNCNGCYDHYGLGYQQPSVPRRCHSCYDDGFDSGPLYRQGPVYRPNYYHQPPPPYYMNPPSYGYPYYPQPAPPPPSMYPYPPPPSRSNGYDEEYTDEEMYPSEDMFPGDDEYSGHEPANEERFNEEEWEQVVQKCKVVNVDENTVIIKNCTMADLGDNPYAASRVEEGTEQGKQQDEIVGADRDIPEDTFRSPLAYQNYQNYDPYYNYPPPNAGYYGGPPPPYYYPQYGQFGARPSGHGQRSAPRRSDVALRPVENFDRNGAEIIEEGNNDDGDESWTHDEEDLIAKGFEVVEEKDM